MIPLLTIAEFRTRINKALEELETKDKDDPAHRETYWDWIDILQKLAHKED